MPRTSWQAGEMLFLYVVQHTRHQKRLQTTTQYLRLSSGDLVSEKKTNNNKKCLTWRCLRVEYMYTSVLNGPCKRHEMRMLRTSNNEYSSLSRLFDVCTATVIHVLRYYHIARDPKEERKPNILEKQSWLAAPNQQSHIQGKEGL